MYGYVGVYVCMYVYVYICVYICMSHGSVSLLYAPEPLLGNHYTRHHAVYLKGDISAVASCYTFAC